MTLRTRATLIVSSCSLLPIGLLEHTSALRATAADWAHRDDAGQFVTGRRPAFAAANLSDDTFATLGLDVVASERADGRIACLCALPG